MLKYAFVRAARIIYPENKGPLDRVKLLLGKLRERNSIVLSFELTFVFKIVYFRYCNLFGTVKVNALLKDKFIVFRQLLSVLKFVLFKVNLKRN